MMYTQFAHKNKQIMKTNTNNIKKIIVFITEKQTLEEQMKTSKKD